MLKEEKVQLQPSVISEGAEIEGNLNYPGSVQVYGKFKGNIKAETVNIGESGLFNGLLVVDSLIVYGKVLGEVKCNKLILNKTGSVSAKVKYSHIEIQSGAIITGDLLRQSLEIESGGTIDGKVDKYAAKKDNASAEVNDKPSSSQK